MCLLPVLCTGKDTVSGFIQRIFGEEGGSTGL